MEHIVDTLDREVDKTRQVGCVIGNGRVGDFIKAWATRKNQFPASEWEEGNWFVSPAPERTADNCEAEVTPCSCMSDGLQ